MKRPAQLFKLNIIVCAVFLSALAISFSSCVATVGVTYSYTAPAWAPPYDGISTVHYYYFPDYDMYYDVWANQFWYSDNGSWISSAGLPPMYGDVDLYSSYIVLVNKKYNTPWNDNDYYVHNYPQHCYDNYKNIVVTNRIVKNVAPDHELVPRAFNENTNKVTFMQKQIDNSSNDQKNDNRNDNGNNRNDNGNNGNNRNDNKNDTRTPQNPNPTPEPTTPVPPKQPQHNDPKPSNPPAPTPKPSNPPQYHNVSHQVPIKTIKPFMPPESKNLNYGGGFKKH